MQSRLVGIMSDSHDNRTLIQKAVEVFNKRRVCCVIHAGDFISPFTSLDFRQLTCPIEMVFGNNDGERPGLLTAFQGCGTLLPGPRTFSIQEKKFALMHEPGCLEQIAQASNIDVVVYGHTHDIDIHAGRPLIINPGETGGWLRGKSTVAILDLESMGVEIVDL